MRLRGVYFFAVLSSATTLFPSARCEEVKTPLSVDQVKADANKLNRKRVRIAGFLEKHHYGVSLFNKADTNAIRIRFPDHIDEWRGKPRVILPPIVSDASYLALRRVCRQLYAPALETPHTYLLELDAVVLVLNSQSYNVFSEAPIEIIPLKVYTMKFLLLPPPPLDDPWWDFFAPLQN